jgi:hypothetical protein
VSRVAWWVVAALWPPRAGANCMRKHDTAIQCSGWVGVIVGVGVGVGGRLTEQSEPAVSGHGRQAPELQLPRVVQPPRSSPILHPQLKS